MSRIVLALALLLAAAGISRAGQVPVSIIDNTFSPDTVHVSLGDSVVWTNNGANSHTTTSGVDGVPDGLWDSGTLAHAATFTYGFTVDGTFHYFCSFHYRFGMMGVVIAGTGGGVDESKDMLAVSRGIVGYPNPFRASISLRLWPSGSGCVRIFNASGKLVRTLESGNGASAVWDGRDSRGQQSGPGVYFCAYGSHALAVTRLR